MLIAEKTVLITGANRGVGEALVKEALNRGAKRVLRAPGVHFQTLTHA
jgi:NAD(P)-dependent dehydrogenase (short-subunit alcohol dehydrogenase family)